VPAATKNLKNKLRNTKLEKEILGSKSHNAYSILSSVEQMTDSVELVARAMVVDCGLDPNDKTATKLSTEEEGALNREIAEKVNEMMNDDDNRCTDGDALDNIEEVAMCDAIDPESEKTRDEDKSMSEKLGFNRYMIESVWKIGRLPLLADNVKATCIQKRKCDICRRRINEAIRATMFRGYDQGKGFKKEAVVATSCWKHRPILEYPEYYK
jgi:hypothetical protein